MKNFKKSEFAIYAIALMLVAAGYFNYSTFEQESLETYSENVEELEEEHSNIGDAVLVSTNDTENTNEQEKTNETENTNNQEKTNETENTASNLEQTNEQTTYETDTTDYFVSSKLERDKMYAEMTTNYENIINTTNASEAQKSIATQEITKINNTKNAIMICENLIITKGFENCIIFANEESINVVVKIEGGLTTESVAKIQNIVARELGTQIENIHITEK